MMRNLIKIIALVGLAALFTLSAGCAQDERKPKEITIAGQFGLAYAPLEIARELKLIEKYAPDTRVNWKQLGNTTAIREAMLAKEADIGYMAIPPFLIGWDKGMEWKISGGLSSSPVGLVTYKDHVRTLGDFTDGDRIALPQPGSVQHILLSMACEKQLGDYKKLDNLLVTMAHPDGMNALAAKKDVTAHFTASPYLEKEMAMEGNHLILSGEEVMGEPFTFIVGVTTKSFHDQEPEAYEAFTKAMEEAIQYIDTNREDTLRILSKAYSLSEQEIKEYLDMEGVVYSSNISGVEGFASFMQRSGYISKRPELEEIIWESVQHENK